MDDLGTAVAIEAAHGALKSSYRKTLFATLLATAVLTGLWLGLSFFGWAMFEFVGMDVGSTLMMVGLLLAPFALFGAIRVVRPPRVAGWLVAGMLGFVLSVVAYVAIILVVLVGIMGYH